jgi:hypothetical protein
VSRGHIKSPEQLHPDEDVDRTTASAIYQRDFGDARWQTTLAWGRNAPTHGEATNAYLLESALALSRKLTGGYIYDFSNEGYFKVGLGGLVSKYTVPDELHPVYGASPTSFMVFARVRIR